MAVIQKTTSGTFRVLVRSKGVYKSKNFKTMADARAFASSVESQIRSATFAASDGLVPMPKSVTVSMLVDKFFAKCEESKTEVGKTKAATFRSLQKHRIGQVKCVDITRLVLTDYANERLKKVSGASVAGDLSIIASLFRWARVGLGMDIHTDKLIRTVRESLSERGIDTRSQQRERVATDQEIEAICAHISAKQRNTLPIRDLMEFIHSSGLRQAEVGRMLWKDVDLVRRSLFIFQRKHPTQKKSNSQTVPLPPDAFAVLTRMRAKIDDADFDPEAKCFPCEIRSAAAAFQRACKALGIEGLRWHDARRKSISALLNKNLSIALVASVSGHRSWASLKRYSTTSVEEFHAQYDKVVGGIKTGQ
jgi:integrase